MHIIDINGKSRECLRVFLDPAWPGYVSVEFQSKADQSKTRIEWMPIVDFANRNPNLDDLLKGHTNLPPEFSGVVSKAGKDSLTDSTKNWLKNTYAGYYVWISRGLGEGQTRTIMSHTKNKLIIDKPWTVKPNMTSQYTVLRHLGSTDQQGNTLPSQV